MSTPAKWVDITCDCAGCGGRAPALYTAVDGKRRLCALHATSFESSVPMCHCGQPGPVRKWGARGHDRFPDKVAPLCDGHWNSAHQIPPPSGANVAAEHARRWMAAHPAEPFTEPNWPAVHAGICVECGSVDYDCCAEPSTDGIRRGYCEQCEAGLKGKPSPPRGFYRHNVGAWVAAGLREVRMDELIYNARQAKNDRSKKRALRFDRATLEIAAHKGRERMSATYLKDYPSAHPDEAEAIVDLQARRVEAHFTAWQRGVCGCMTASDHDPPLVLSALGRKTNP